MQNNVNNVSWDLNIYSIKIYGNSNVSRNKGSNMLENV